MAIVWLMVVDVVAACGAVRASAGSRRWSCSYSGAVPGPLFVARPPSKVERGRRWAGAQATNRGVGVREPGCSGRLASRNGSVEGGQRGLVSLQGLLVSTDDGSPGYECERGALPMTIPGNTAERPLRPAPLSPRLPRSVPSQLHGLFAPLQRHELQVPRGTVEVDVRLSVDSPGTVSEEHWQN